MMEFSARGLRIRLVMLVLLAVLPAMVLMALSSLEQQRGLTAEAQEEALRLARLGAVGHERVIEGARQLLSALAEVPDVMRGSGPRCARLLSRLLRQNRQYANLGVADTTGRVTCSGRPSSGRVVIADRPYFRDAVRLRGFSVGQYQVGRITKRPTLNFGYPVFERRRVAGVVFAALDLVNLSRLPAEINLPAGAAMTVLDARGTVLAHYPDPGRFVGRRYSDLPLTRRVLAKREGLVEESGLDGVARLYAFTPLGAEGKAFVAVGLPRGQVLGRARSLLVRNLLALGGIAVIAAGAALLLGSAFVVRPVREAIAREQEASARLQALDMQKTAFMQAVSHDLGNPVAAILVVAELLKRTGLSEDALELVGRVDANARQLARLLSELLDLDRLARGDVQAHPKPTALTALVRGVLSNLGLTDGRVRTRIDAPVAHVDPVQTERIIENLVVNSLKHTPAETPIWVRATRTPEGILLTVEDAGPGIADELKERIFEPFGRGNTRARGTGMGLALVSRFAQLQGGRAWVDDRPGGGASFKVLLPEPPDA